MSARHGSELIVGAFQFAGSDDPARNAAALERGIREAAQRGVRLLATQECALSGYAPLEVESPETVDRVAQRTALRRIAQLAEEHSMYVVLGMTTFYGKQARNTVRLVTPDGALHKPYHKRALYGWDETHYVPGSAARGVHRVDGVRIGLRICYEVRFPEYFRELFRRRVQLAVVSFADVGPHEDKYDVVLAHLVSRAAENVMYVLSANSVSGPQVAPTCLADPDGRLLARAPRAGEALITGTIGVDPPNFGRKGRIKLSSRLCVVPSQSDRGIRGSGGQRQSRR